MCTVESYRVEYRENTSLAVYVNEIGDVTSLLKIERQQTRLDLNNNGCKSVIITLQMSVIVWICLIPVSLRNNMQYIFSIVYYYDTELCTVIKCFVVNRLVMDISLTF